MYDEKVTYRVGINWKDVILKIILLTSDKLDVLAPNLT